MEALGKNDETYDPSLPLSKELQLHQWPVGYNPCIQTFYR
jgi:hypothetical protein